MKWQWELREQLVEKKTLASTRQHLFGLVFILASLLLKAVGYVHQSPEICKVLICVLPYILKHI